MRVTHRLMETTIAACLGTALLLLSSLTAVAGQPGGPDLTPGFYRVTPVDRNSRASENPPMLCAADAQALLRLGHGNDSGCHDRGSEELTCELQSLVRILYAVLGLTKDRTHVPNSPITGSL